MLHQYLFGQYSTGLAACSIPKPYTPSCVQDGYLLQVLRTQYAVA